MTLFRNFFSCVRGHRSHAHRRVSSQTKIKFGQPLERICAKDSHLPRPLFRLITFLAHEGTQANDLFRKPGNISQINVIIKQLAQGKTVQWSNYNLYTAANVAKKYLLNLPGGLFGRKGEAVLLATAGLSEEDRINEFLKLLRQMPAATKELTILLFGILFRMVCHAVNMHSVTFSKTSPQESAQNLTESPAGPGQPKYTRSPTNISIESQSFATKQAILAEAVAKSVAGSLFHTCRDLPEKVEIAVKVLQSLILSFPSFDVEFIDYFDQAVNKLSHSSSSTGSFHEMSLSGSSKIVGKPSGLESTSKQFCDDCLGFKRNSSQTSFLTISVDNSTNSASFELWTENISKSMSQRSSLKGSLHRSEKMEHEAQRLFPTELLSIHIAHIPSIMITSPQGDVHIAETNERVDQRIFIEEVRSPPIPEQIPYRHHQARYLSMKRRHQANLKKRSDWFLNNTPTPPSPIFRIDETVNTVVVVTCGGSSICLGQSKPIASGNRCMLLHSNDAVLMPYNLTSSGPDILQTNSRPGTPNYSIMSHDGQDSFYSSLANSDAHLYDTGQTEMEQTSFCQSQLTANLHMSSEPEAPNSVPLIRRMLPSRSSTTSRKNSAQNGGKPVETPEYSYEAVIPRMKHDDEDDEEEYEEEDYIIDDTQSSYY